MESKLFLLLLLGSFVSQGGRATVTYQPTPLQGQGCPSDENIAQVIEKFHSLIEDRVDGTVTHILQTVNDYPPGLTQQLPAASCQDIFQNRPDLPSGNYWIRSSNGTAVQLYCDMARQCCSETTGGWTRIAFLNMTDPNQQCPPAWREITAAGVRTCRRQNDRSCQSTNYPSHGISYSRVCGRVTGYQYCTTDGFQTNTSDIDGIYVDGISITHGRPRQPVWTFVSGHDALANDQCPCIDNPNSANTRIPSFVGDDYFCDTAYTVISVPTCGSIASTLPVAHPLWDGGGCGPNGGYCESNNPPWFCKILPQPTTDDIEVRICADQSFSDEDILVELIEFYIN